jgi:hypothetical protein
MSYVLLGFTALCAVLIFAACAQSAQVKRLKSENAGMKAEIENAAKRLEHLREYMQKEKAITEAGNEKRRELEGTPDSGLAGRANALWGGVRNGGTGNGGGAA